MKRQGFTWIEFLLTLTAIVVLAAVLWPVFQRQRPEPNRNGCQQNIRQIGLAIKQYLGDHGESFPTVANGGPEYGWAGVALPYLRNANLFQCPNEEAYTSDGAIPIAPFFTDYFYNARLSGEKESALQYIASTIMLGDAIPGDARRHSTGGSNRAPNGTANLVDSGRRPVGAATRHLDGANYAFADGHVKWLKGSDANTVPAIRADASGATAPTFSIY